MHVLNKQQLKMEGRNFYGASCGGEESNTSPAPEVTPVRLEKDLHQKRGSR